MIYAIVGLLLCAIFIFVALILHFRFDVHFPLTSTLGVYCVLFLGTFVARICFGTEPAIAYGIGVLASPLLVCLPVLLMYYTFCFVRSRTKKRQVEYHKGDSEYEQQNPD